MDTRDKTQRLIDFAEFISSCLSLKGSVARTRHDETKATEFSTRILVDTDSGAVYSIKLTEWKPPLDLEEGVK